MQISIRSEIKNTLKDFKDIRQKSIPYAITQAINDTLFDLTKELPKEMQSVFDNPVPFTLNPKAWEVKKALHSKASNKHPTLTGVIRLRPKQAEYLRYQAHGGKQRPKRKAIPVAQKDGELTASHGGLKKGWSSRVQDKKRYFTGVPRGGGRPGIYKRLGVKKRKPSGEDIRLEVSFEKSTQYSKRFKVYESGYAYIQRNFANNFRKRLQKAREYQQSKGISR